MKKTTLLILGLALTAGVQAENLDRSLWSWSASSICAPGTESDIVGLQGIYDGNATTCWHSNYQAADGSAERINPHWVQIDRGADASPFSGLAYLPRQNFSSNTSCTEYYIYISDKDMSSTPANSAADIVRILGAPTFSGSWSGDIQEKFVDFGTAYKSRYILFVNVASKSSKSAACAEMNLYYGSSGSGGGEVPPMSYNALCITPVGKDATPHRIAIQGEALTVSLNHEYVRLGNSDITVEYNMADVARFSFEQYSFDEESSYEGDKKDIYSSRFTPSVMPASGEIDALNEVTVVISPSRKHRVNPDSALPIVIEHDGTTVMSVPHTSLGDFAVDNGYTFTGLGVTTPGQYTLTIPAEMFICADGTRSNNVERNWTIADQQGKDGLQNVEIPTLTVKCSGGVLYVGGIAPGCSEVELYNVGGQLAAAAKVDSHGRAELAAGTLARGVYFLNVNGITLKIIL